MDPHRDLSRPSAVPLRSVVVDVDVRSSMQEAHNLDRHPLSR